MKNPLYLVAVDGSEWGERAAERAIRLAEQVSGRVTLLTVMDWSHLQSMMLDGPAVNTPPFNKEEEEQSTYKRVLNSLMEKYAETDVEISAELLWGDPVEVILEQVKVVQANMLFVGRQGRSRLIDLLLGSVANKLAHRVGIPIVLVP